MATSERIYEDFNPVSDLLSDEECDTLLLYLPGFRKEQLKVQLSASRVLRVFGERPIGDNKWRRFHMEFQVPSNIQMERMTAKFEGGILYIRQPKVIAPEAKEQEDKEKRAAEAEAPVPELQQEASSEGKTEKKDEREEDATEKREKDKISEEKNDNREEKSELNKILAAQAGHSSGLFKELRKPEKLRKLVQLVVYVILLLILAFQIMKMFKSSNKSAQQSVLEYDHQEL